MIVFELLFLNSPYAECENSYDISEKIIEGIPPERPFELGPEYSPLINLFINCTSSPANRPSSSQLINTIKQLPTTKEERATPKTPKSLPISAEQTFVNPLYKGETLPILPH